MELEVRFFANLRQKFKKIETIEVEENTTIQDLLKKLELDKETIIVMINGKVKPLDYELKFNDRVALFPPVGGG